MIVGIDPGTTGALALLDDNGFLIDHVNIQAVGGRIVVTPISAFLTHYHDRITAVQIEAVHAMPKQGVSTTFTFGRALGCIEGVVESMGLPCFSVPPNQWKRAYNFTGKDKDAPRAEALRRWPHVEVLRLKGKGQAVADAAFIGLYGARS